MFSVFLEFLTTSLLDFICIFLNSFMSLYCFILECSVFNTWFLYHLILCFVCLSKHWQRLRGVDPLFSQTICFFAECSFFDSWYFFIVRSALPDTHFYLSFEVNDVLREFDWIFYFYNTSRLRSTTAGVRSTCWDNHVAQRGNYVYKNPDFHRSESSGIFFVF